MNLKLRLQPGRPGEVPLIPIGVLVLAISVWQGVLMSASRDLRTTFGDTDDALRLVIVRDLLSGRAGWYDQHLGRLQPPLGMDSHWSRLVDGGLAALQRLFELFMAPPQAELAMRFTWPLLWIPPVVFATLIIARRLAGPSGAFLAAVICAMSLSLYLQWLPGRIDHHDVQITLCMLAVAGAVLPGRAWALAASLATGLGLAVGVEALVFLAIVGAGFALRFAFGPQDEERRAQAYAAGLLCSLTLLFLIQTPPARWGVSVCDALGVNLTAAIAVGCLAFLAAMPLVRNRNILTRLIALAGVGGMAGAVYVAMLPTCIGGPLAQADPRLWSIWLNNVAEMRPLLLIEPGLYAGLKLSLMVIILAGAAAALWLGLARRRRDADWILLTTCFAVAVAVSLGAARMAFYAGWFAVPLIATAAWDLGSTRWRGRLIPVFVLVASVPMVANAAQMSLQSWHGRQLVAATHQMETCARPDAYRLLAGLPTGLVLSEIDEGPNVLVTTMHAVVAAPYHRMAWGIIAGHDALGAQPGSDERAVRGLGVTYVLNCPGQAANTNHSQLDAQSLQARLDRRQTPDWLQPLSPASAPLQVYAVRPLP